MSNRLTWEYITTTATRTYRSWSPKQIAQFHYFNPNGLYAAKKASDDRISEAVSAGKCKSGALLAYGSFNDFSINKLREHINGCTLRQIHVTLSGIEADIASANQFLLTL